MDTEIDTPEADHRQLQQLVTGLIEGVVLLDEKGNITWASMAAPRLHGCEVLKALGATAHGHTKQFSLHCLNHHVLKASQYPSMRVASSGESFSGNGVEVSRNTPVKEGLRCVHEIRSAVVAWGRERGLAGY